MFQHKCKTPWINIRKKIYIFPMEIYMERNMDAIITIDGVEA